MSLQVIKAGILDTIQDGGRLGFQHLGINTGGSVDRYAAALANALLGKECTGPVLECHFPTAQLLFETPTIICITGADFCPVVNGIQVPLNQPIVLGKNSLLQFQELRTGQRCYIAILHALELTPWLNSYSTNLRAGVGGYMGRGLKKGDQIKFKQDEYAISAPERCTRTLFWKAKDQKTITGTVSFRPGHEWNWLSKEAQECFIQQQFYIKSDSDRMGLRLNGIPLEASEQSSLVSCPVNFGTIQLLPNGQLIILMADHQTTGGYPRIGHVITTDLSLLAQMRPGDSLSFQNISLIEAEERIVLRQRYLEQLRSVCRIRIVEVIQKGKVIS